MHVRPLLILVWQSCWFRFVFYQLWLSTKRHVRFSIINPGWVGVDQYSPFVYASPAQTPLLSSRKKRLINNSGVISTLSLLLGFPFLTMVIRTSTSNWEQGAYSRPVPKETALPSVRCEPAIHRLQLRSLTCLL